jgi:uncharacterized membrane protein
MQGMFQNVSFSFLNLGLWFMVYGPLQQYFSYIVVVSFIAFTLYVLLSFILLFNYNYIFK